MIFFISLLSTALSTSAFAEPTVQNPNTTFERYGPGSCHTWVYKKFDSCRHEDNGVEEILQGTGKQCKVLLRKKKRSEFCPVELYRYDTGTVCGTTKVLQRETRWSVSGHSPCNSGEVSERSTRQVRDCIKEDFREGNCAKWGYVNQYRFKCYLTQVGSCRHHSFGVERRKSCRHKNHEPEKFDTCRHKDFGVIHYKLPNEKCGKTNLIVHSDYGETQPVIEHLAEIKCITGDNLPKNGEITDLSLQQKFDTLYQNLTVIQRGEINNIKFETQVEIVSSLKHMVGLYGEYSFLPYQMENYYKLLNDYPEWTY